MVEDRKRRQYNREVTNQGERKLREIIQHFSLSSLDVAADQCGAL